MFRFLVSFLLLSLLAIACTESQLELSMLRDVGVGCGGFSDFPPVSEVIARDVLTREGDELYIGAEEYEDLVSELAGVVRAITEEYPALADIHAIPDYASGQVVVGVEGDLRESISAMGIERPDRGPVDFITGSHDFDALNI